MAGFKVTMGAIYPAPAELHVIAVMAPLVTVAEHAAGVDASTWIDC